MSLTKAAATDAKEFTHDAEHLGAWTAPSYRSSQEYPTEDAELGAARAAVPARLHDR